LENKQFFDPYNFNNVVMQPANQPVTNIEESSFMPSMGLDPSMFYQQQFWYYNYMTKMLEYKMKLKEYENMNKNKS